MLAWTDWSQAQINPYLQELISFFYMLQKQHEPTQHVGLILFFCFRTILHDKHTIVLFMSTFQHIALQIKFRLEMSPSPYQHN